jgi:hypothetical protein
MIIRRKTCQAGIFLQNFWGFTTGDVISSKTWTRAAFFFNITSMVYFIHRDAVWAG